MKKFKSGIQLYSLRNEMAKDFEGTLKTVSEIGYNCVEFAGYYEHTAEEIKEILDKYGLTAPSVHQGYDAFLENGQQKADFLKILGVKYMSIPGILLTQSTFETPEYKQIIDDVKNVCHLLKKNGLDILYHNHAHEFEKYNGKYILEHLLKDTDNMLMPEIDVCWVHFADINPAEYMLNYKDRLPVLHLKDFSYNSEDMPHPIMRPLGDGVVDIPSVIKSAEKCKTEYLIVEQDNFTDIKPLEAAERSYNYLNSICL